MNVDKDDGSMTRGFSFGLPISLLLWAILIVSVANLALGLSHG